MADLTQEGSLEQVVSEQDFAPLLSRASQDFHLFANELVQAGPTPWSKRQLFLLYTEADELESFLDDYGARTNRTYATITEFVASVRGFALAGLSLEHLLRRLEGYAANQALEHGERAEFERDVAEARTFVQCVLLDLIRAVQQEATNLGAQVPEARAGSTQGAVEPVHIRLAHDLGQEDIAEEHQIIAEVSSKYLQAAQMLEKARVDRSCDATERDRYLREECSEERARVYEATVHNLQSAYDTHIKNTVTEADDERLRRLRGHISATLHLLEAVTQLTHFVERHESDVRHDAARVRLAELAPRSDVDEVTMTLLFWAGRIFLAGRALAEDLLPAYTNLQALKVEIEEGVVLHARPASLVVSIVNHYGTPVEMELEGQTCNAGSILEMMVLIGSYPDARHFIFRGDANPLMDIGALFESGLGERGLDSLPDSLGYLRG